MRLAPPGFLEECGPRLANALWIAAQASHNGKCYRCKRPDIVTLIISTVLSASPDGFKIGSGITAAGVCHACTCELQLDEKSTLADAQIVME
jgi:hypothetical protein